MKFLLLLLLMFCQDTDKLLQDLNNDDPIVRQDATKQLMEQERNLGWFKSLVSTTSDPEVKWRLAKVVETIEANQKFRSLSTVSPLITIKFSGEIKDLFAKLTEITGHKLDVRAFGDNKVTVDYVDAPLFKVLDEACKQIGYDWEVTRYDVKGDFIKSTDIVTEYTTSINLAGMGMSNKTPSYTASGFKMQATQTHISIHNKFNEITTEVAILFKYAVDPGIHYSAGPKIKYTKIIADGDVNLKNYSEQSDYCLASAPPTTKHISIAGKATYRIPMKVEDVVLDISPIYNIKPDANGNATMEFLNSNFSIIKSGAQMYVYSKGDYKMKERFLGKYEIKDKNGNIVLGNRGTQTGNGYISTSDDYWVFYVYGSNGTPFEISTISFDFITEFRDISFDFAIDNIPLY